MGDAALHRSSSAVALNASAIPCAASKAAPSLPTSAAAESDAESDGEDGGHRALRDAEADDGRLSLTPCVSATSQSGRSSKSSGKAGGAAREDAFAAPVDGPVKGRGGE